AARARDGGRPRRDPRGGPLAGAAGRTGRLAGGRRRGRDPRREDRRPRAPRDRRRARGDARQQEPRRDAPRDLASGALEQDGPLRPEVSLQQQERPTPFPFPFPKKGASQTVVSSPATGFGASRRLDADLTSAVDRERERERERERARRAGSYPD